MPGSGNAPARVNGSPAAPSPGTTLPVRPQGLVDRRRLRDRLDAAVTAPVTLVASPPGTGKTLLLTDWAWRQRGDVAWLTLDGSATTVAALADRIAGALGVAHGPVPPAGTDVVLALRAALDLRDGPVVLVLDDAHEAPAAELGLALRALAGHPALRLVVGTRVDPDLPLHRLRLAGQLAEVRADDLAFTPAEADTLLRGQGVALEPASLELLLARTEGWAAGLRLAALLLDAHPAPEQAVREFAGDDRAVVAYLLHEVLDRQPEEVRELLIRTAVVDRVSGELADALTGGTGGQAILEQLVAANAFVLPLDRRGHWFRYHAMFGDLLRALLRARGTVAWAEQHRRAARFLQQAGDVERALVHATEAGDWDLVDTALRDCWISVRAEGRGSVLDRAVARVPAEAVQRRPQLAVVVAARLLDADHEEAAEALLGLALEHRGRVGGRRREQLTRDVALVRLDAAVRRGDAGAARRAGGTVLSLAHDDDDAGGTAARALALTGLGHVSVADGEPDAEERLRGAAAAARAAGLPCVAARAEALRAWCYALDGHVRQAAAAARTTAAADVEGHLARSLVAAETGDLATADAAIRRAAAACAEGGGRLRALELELSRARLLHRAPPDAQQAMLSALDRLSAGWAPPRRLATAATAARIRLLAALGRAGEAVELARPVAAGSPAPLIALAHAEALLALGDPGAAHAAALRALEEPATPGVAGAARDVPTAVAAFALAAAAAEADGRRPEAVAAAERALDLAEPDGLRLALVDALPALEPVLRHLLRYGTAHRALIGDVLQLAAPGGGTGPAAADCPPLGAELSERELVVLRHLPTMLTSQEIAGELFVTLNTVKSHLRAIYRKLDVGGRREAVERARALGLLAPGAAGGPAGRLSPPS